MAANSEAGKASIEAPAVPPSAPRRIVGLPEKEVSISKPTKKRSKARKAVLSDGSQEGNLANIGSLEMAHSSSNDAMTPAEGRPGVSIAEEDAESQKALLASTLVLKKIKGLTKRIVSSFTVCSSLAELI